MNAEPEFLYLTTTGRRTGCPREIEIWFTETNGRFYLIAEHGEAAQWVPEPTPPSSASPS